MLTAAPRRAALRRRLLAWWDAAHRPLPWRFPQRGADPYRVWLAEVMLQQTQVRTVLPYYARFVDRFPTLEALAAASEDEVLALWSGLGYYARGRNLLAAAREALARHGGLPASLEALRALPGFGPYTAGAVASIAFAIPAAAVDGNVVRVLARAFAVRGRPAAPRFRERVNALARELVGADRPPLPGPQPLAAPRTDRSGEEGRGEGAGRRVLDRPGDLNQSLMELGATVCTPRSPACARCPIAPLCAARAAGIVEQVPPPRCRPARKVLVLACAILRRDGRILLARRPAGGLFGGLWTPPAVEVREGEDAGAALARALRREHGIRGTVLGETASCERTLTHRALTLRAFAVRTASPPAERDGLRWAPGPALDAWGVPTAVRALLANAAGAPGRVA
ncbi:MAG TPA: A/G-specific adenine glycosylase [Anaeromyxobacter sp.]